MRSKYFFNIVLVFILVLVLILHLYVNKNNNFYFTVDQGRDAVYVRQILNHHQIFTRGPETNIKGIFTGPLGDYFIAIGYFVFGGHPYGAVFIMIILNLLTTFVLAKWIAKNFSRTYALFICFLFQFFWGFFASALWGFHPFPLVFLSLMEVICLIKFLDGEKKYYLVALGIVFLAFNAEVAGAISLFIFYFVIGIWATKKKIISSKHMLVLSAIFGSFIIYFAREFILQIVRAKIFHTTVVNSSYGKMGVEVFTGTNFTKMASEFLKLIGGVAISQNVYLGVLLFFIITFFFVRLKNKNKFVEKFVYLIFILAAVSFLFFASNKGWRDWHTIYLAPLLFISLLLMILSLPKKVFVILLSIILFSQTVNFYQRYTSYLKPSPDPSLLYNQEKVLDWVYTHSEGNGFNLYTYTKSFYDYPYQYLVSWYGKAKYGFYPCEYSNFPLSIKSLYIPHPENYVEPKLGCDKFRFLIIDSDTNGNENKDWMNDFRNLTIFVEETRIGNTTIEKRKTPDIIKG